MADRTIILNTLKKIGRVHSSIDKVVLFGSQATNKATQYSDYDVLILLKQDYSRTDENRILDICYDVDLI